MTDQLYAWRVHDMGRQAHLVPSAGSTARQAACGETGTGWRVVTGVDHCPDCEQVTSGTR